MFICAAGVLRISDGGIESMSALIKLNPPLQGQAWIP